MSPDADAPRDMVQLLRDTKVRSMLFAPGNEPRKMARLGTFGADTCVIDLEDAVPDDLKAATRPTVADSLAGIGQGIRCVRVNALSTGWCDDDIDSIVGPDLDAIILAKTSSGDEVRHVVAQISRLETERDLPAGAIALLPLVESAQAVEQMTAIATAAPGRVPFVVFGSGDYALDIGAPLDDRDALLFARSTIVNTSRAHGLRPPVDGPYVDLSNVDGLRDSSTRSARLGFQGRVVVYPPQVDVVNDTFLDATSMSVEQARRVVDVFETGLATGSASMIIDGDFVDYPLYHKAVELLERADTT